MTAIDEKDFEVGLRSELEACLIAGMSSVSGMITTCDGAGEQAKARAAIHILAARAESEPEALETLIEVLAALRSLSCYEVAFESILWCATDENLFELLASLYQEFIGPDPAGGGRAYPRRIRQLVERLGDRQFPVMAKLAGREIDLDDFSRVLNLH